VNGAANITTTSTMTLGNMAVGGALSAIANSGGITQTAGTIMSVTGLASFNAPLGIITLDGNNSFAGGEIIIDQNGDRSKQSSDVWVFQQNAVDGGTQVRIPLPKLLVLKSTKLPSALVYGNQVELVAENLIGIPEDFINIGVAPFGEPLGVIPQDLPNEENQREGSNARGKSLGSLNSDNFRPVVFQSAR
jgi:hypothetical protein